MVASRTPQVARPNAPKNAEVAPSSSLSPVRRINGENRGALSIHALWTHGLPPGEGSSRGPSEFYCEATRVGPTASDCGKQRRGLRRDYGSALERKQRAKAQCINKGKKSRPSTHRGRRPKVNQSSHVEYPSPSRQFAFHSDQNRHRIWNELTPDEASHTEAGLSNLRSQ